MIWGGKGGSIQILKGRKFIEGRYRKFYGFGVDVCLLVMRNRCGEFGRDRVEINLERIKVKFWGVCGLLQVLDLDGIIQRSLKEELEGFNRNFVFLLGVISWD